MIKLDFIISNNKDVILSLHTYNIFQNTIIQNHVRIITDVNQTIKKFDFYTKLIQTKAKYIACLVNSQKCLVAIGNGSILFEKEERRSFASLSNQWSWRQAVRLFFLLTF